MIAHQTATPVVPVSTSGMGAVLPPGRHWPRRARVTVRFGEALHYKGQGYDEFTQEVELTVRKLHSMSD